MSEADRRDFLKQTAGGVAAISALGISRSARGVTKPKAGIPPHQPLRLPGLHAYAEKSVAAGETVHFCVSSDLPYKLSLFRLAGEVDDDKSDILLHEFTESPARQQPIHPGSYIHVDHRLPVAKPLQALTLECWVRPWRLNEWQGLITQYDYPKSCGIGLFIGPRGAHVYFGEGGERDDARDFAGGELNHRRWNHLAATWDGASVTLWVNGRRAGSWELDDEVLPADVPLRLASYGENGLTSGFFDGDLAMPLIYSRALTPAEIRQRIDARGSAPPLDDALACWLLSEEDGDEVADASRHQRHGRIVNHATWMIGGPKFKGEGVGRYDTSYDPANDDQRGHGLRFASDDLFDCRWAATHAYDIPQQARPGVYVGRFDYRLEGRAFPYHVTFIVRRPKDCPRAPVLVLCSTSTWLAYNAAPFPVPVDGPVFLDPRGLTSSAAAAPAYSCYRNHHHGQPTYYLGLNMPWPAAGPNILFSPPQIGYSHLMRGELFLHRFLDGQYGGPEFAYDVVTDLDLHRDPELLTGYKTLVINGHSEYWSAAAYDGVDRYLEGGGTVVGLSGNTMFWRTSFSRNGTVMECRKFDPRIGGRGGATIGELYHSDDQRRGSLMRECGYPAWKNIGLECIGWWDSRAAKDFGVYYTERPDHFLWERPEKIELAEGESFGHAAGGKVPRAGGHEGDVRLRTLLKITRHVPEGYELPKEPEGIVTLARCKREAGGGVLDYLTEGTREPANVSAEIIYWERPQGGRVFHTGAVGAGWALAGDAKLRALLRNVLHHFGVRPETG